MSNIGYTPQAGPWTPEATVEHPEAVRQLHREFLRAGSDVMQVGHPDYIHCKYVWPRVCHVNT